jgi:hypothetical protein
MLGCWFSSFVPAMRSLRLTAHPAPISREELRGQAADEGLRAASSKGKNRPRTLWGTA